MSFYQNAETSMFPQISAIWCSKNEVWACGGGGAQKFIRFGKPRLPCETISMRGWLNPIPKVFFLTSQPLFLHGKKPKKSRLNPQRLITQPKNWRISPESNNFLKNMVICVFFAHRHFLGKSPMLTLDAGAIGLLGQWKISRSALLHLGRAFKKRRFQNPGIGKICVRN